MCADLPEIEDNDDKHDESTTYEGTALLIYSCCSNAILFKGTKKSVNVCLNIATFTVKWS